MCDILNIISTINITEIENKCICDYVVTQSLFHFNTFVKKYILINIVLQGMQFKNLINNMD